MFLKPRSRRLLALLTLVPAGLASGQPPQTKPAAPATAPAPGARPTGAEPVLATVNNEPIKQSELIRLLSQFSVPPGSEQRAYASAMDLLVNTKLLAQFLRDQKIAIPPKEIDDYVARYDQSARANNTSLTAELATNNTTLEEFRDRIGRTLQWQKYVLSRAGEAELKKHMDTNKDIFNGTQVRASHILIRVEPDASEADKKKAQDRLSQIKAEIDAGKISFADAANKYSEDPGNKQTPSGGDLSFFPRKGQFIEPFSAAAFEMKKGEVRGPVETEYGYHLIQLTDRREGQELEFEKVRDQILDHYAAELQEKVVAAERKKAEAAGAIKIQPMPAGLIKPDVPAPGTAPAAEPGKPAAPAATKPAAPAAATPKSAAPATAKPAGTPKS